MDEKLCKAYETLVPNDQLIVDSLIVRLVEKDKQIHGLIGQLQELLDEKGEN